MEDSKTPMINSIISIVFNISLNLILVKPLGYKGLAIATAVSAYIGLFLFNRSMKKKIEGYSSKDNYIVFAKALFAALIMGQDRKSTRLNSSHRVRSRMPSSA